MQKHTKKWGRVGHSTEKKINFGADFIYLYIIGKEICH